MRPSDAGDLLRRAVPPPWDELRAARTQRRVLEGLRAKATADPPRAVPWRRRAVWLAAAVAVAAAALLVVLGRGWFGGHGASTVVANGSRLELPDGSVVELATVDGQPAARVVPALVSPNRIELDQLEGTASYAVAKNPERTFVVRAGDVRVEVLGTHFRVEKLPNTVRVVVTEGRVQVSRDDRVVILLGGEDVTFGDGEVGAMDLPPVPQASATADASAEPAAPAVSASAAPPSPSQSATPAASSAASAQRDPNGAAKLMRQADDARAAGDSDEALRLLRQLVAEYPRDQRTPIALFTMGRLELKRGNALAAARAFDACGGAMGGEAMAEAALAYSAAGKSAQAKTLANQYLQQFPEGQRRGQMEPLTK